MIALVGGATGLIGDPSGKSAERNMLTLEQVEENKRGIRENLSRILDFDGPNAAIMVDNYDWYKSTSAIEFLRDIAINFRVPQMLAKESVKKRLEASDGALTFTEFSYQILQGNDFLHLYDNYGCRLEVGGADQWGNITAGTDLVHRMRGKTAYGLTFPLLLDSAGRKFGKSEGNALFMNGEMTSVYDWYQYFLRAADADVIRYLKVFSMKSLDEIAALEEEMKAKPEARIPQKALAEEFGAQAEYRELYLQAQLGKQYEQELRNEVVRLCLTLDLGVSEPVLRNVMERAGSGDLQQLKAALTERMRGLMPMQTQLPHAGAMQEAVESGFLI